MLDSMRWGNAEVGTLLRLPWPMSWAVLLRSKFLSARRGGGERVLLLPLGACNVFLVWMSETVGGVGYRGLCLAK